MVTQQILRFIIVGSIAAMVNIAGVYFGVRAGGMAPLLANIYAFLAAFVVSYSGHQYWTFAEKQARLSFSWHRFFVIAVIGFALNESLFYLLLASFHLYYLIALPIVLLIIPPLTFMFSQRWAFNDRRGIKGIC